MQLQSAQQLAESRQRLAELLRPAPPKRRRSIRVSPPTGDRRFERGMATQFEPSRSSQNFPVARDLSALELEVIAPSRRGLFGKETACPSCSSRAASLCLFRRFPSGPGTAPDDGSRVCADCRRTVSPDDFVIASPDPGSIGSASRRGLVSVSNRAQHQRSESPPAAGFGGWSSVGSLSTTTTRTPAS